MIHEKKNGWTEGNNDCRRKRRQRNTAGETTERKEHGIINKEK
jgi:hypothetical protein